MNKNQIGTLYALCAAFLFSSKAIFIKQAYALSPHLDATSLMALRMLSALPFFLLMSWLCRQHSKNATKKDWALLILSGLLGYYLASWLDFWGLMYISASLERIILFLYPTLTVIASSILYKHPLSPKIIIAILLSYGGTVLVMLQENISIGHGSFWFGVFLVFASAIAFASYLLLTPRLIKTFGSWNFTGLALSVACLGTLLHFFIATSQPLDILISFSTSIWLYGCALGLFVTVLPTILLMQGIEKIGASQAAMIAAVGPVLTILLAVLFLGEQLNTLQWLGCAINIIGIGIISLSKKRLK